MPISYLKSSKFAKHEQRVQIMDNSRGYSFTKNKKSQGCEERFGKKNTFKWTKIVNPSLPNTSWGLVFGWYVFGVQSYLQTPGVWKPSTWGSTLRPCESLPELGVWKHAIYSYLLYLKATRVIRTWFLFHTYGGFTKSTKNWIISTCLKVLNIWTNPLISVGNSWFKFLITPPPPT